MYTAIIDCHKYFFILQLGLLDLKIKAADREEYSWNLAWTNTNTSLHNFNPNVDYSPLEIHLPRRACVSMNCFRTGVGTSAQLCTSRAWPTRQHANVPRRIKRLTT